MQEQFWVYRRLDSTLALLVCLRACGLLERPASDILAVSMPGPGSSPRSVAISEALAESSACDLMTIDIGEAVEAASCAILGMTVLLIIRMRMRKLVSARRF